MAVYNPGNLRANLRLIFATGDIGRLNQETYDFLTTHAGFLDHEGLEGFKHDYTDLRKFVKHLQTTEAEVGIEAMFDRAFDRATDPTWAKLYGAEYADSMVNSIYAIALEARKWEDVIHERHYLRQASQLAEMVPA